MAQKKKKQRILTKDEFRTNFLDRRKHPAYIFAQVGNEFIFFVITHSSTTRGVKNIALHKSPDPSKPYEKSYFYPKVQRLHRNKFGDVKVGWKLCTEDEKKMKPLKIIPEKKGK